MWIVTMKHGCETNTNTAASTFSTVNYRHAPLDVGVGFIQTRSMSITAAFTDEKTGVSWIRHDESQCGI
jgi:hypothetical protein